MDLLPMRVQNIFSQMFKPDPVQLDPNQISQQQDDDPVTSLLKTLLTPQNTASNNLQEMLKSQPQRADYKPSMLQNIMGRLSGLSESGPAGQANGQMIGYKGMGLAGNRLIHENLDRPYNNAMDDWRAKLKPLSEIADTERAGNSNNRLIASTLMRDEQVKQSDDTKRRGQTLTAQAKADALEQKDRFLSYKYFVQAHPRHEIKSDKDGYLIAIDPQSDESIYIHDDKGNKVKSDRLPDLEKLKITQSNNLGLIGAREGAAEKLEGVKHENDLSEIDARTQSGIDRDAAKPVRPAGTGSKKDPLVPVIAPDGRTGSVPQSKLAEAVKKGFKVK